MLARVLDLPAWQFGILFVGGFVALSMLLALALRPFVQKRFGDEHNAVFDTGFSAVGTMYAIVAGLLVFGVYSTFDDASKAAADEARAKADVSFSPLAMPMLSGPGSIAVTVGFTSLASHWLDYVAIILGILVVAAVSYAILRASHRIVSVIGLNGMNVLTKMMGFLLVCIGIQFVVNGIVGVAMEPELVRGIRDALRQ